MTKKKTIAFDPVVVLVVCVRGISIRDNEKEVMRSQSIGPHYIYIHTHTKI